MMMMMAMIDLCIYYYWDNTIENNFLVACWIVVGQISKTRKNTTTGSRDSNITVVELSQLNRNKNMKEEKKRKIEGK